MVDKKKQDGDLLKEQIFALALKVGMRPGARLHTATELNGLAGLAEAYASFQASSTAPQVAAVADLVRLAELCDVYSAFRSTTEAQHDATMAATSSCDAVAAIYARDRTGK